MTISLLSVGIFLLTVILMSLSTYLFKKIAGTLSLTRLNVFSMTYYALTFLSVIGTTLFMMGFRKHYMARYIRHSDSFLYAYIAVMIMMIVFPATIWLLQKITKFSPQNLLTYPERPVLITRPNAEKWTLSIAALVCLGAVFYTYYKIGLADSPILNMIKKVDAKTLQVLRNKAYAEFPGNQYIKNILALQVTPLVSFITYIMARLRKERFWWFITAVLFVASNLILFYDLEKMPILSYWITFFVLSLYLGDRIRWRWIIGLMGAVVVAIVVMYVWIAHKSLASMFSLTDGPMSRIFLTTPIAFILHLEVFRYRAPFLNGQSLTSFLGKLAGFSTVVRSGSVVMQAVNFTGIRLGSAGVYSGLFLSEAYANFGLRGLYFAMIHLPVVFFIMVYVFTKLPKTPYTVALYAFYTMNFLLTLHAGYTDYFFSMIRFTLVIITVMMVLFSKFISRFTDSSSSGTSLPEKEYTL